jgi:alpha-tubulin suppressor-like RCC1 family protein
MRPSRTVSTSFRTWVVGGAFAVTSVVSACGGKDATSPPPPPAVKPDTTKPSVTLSVTDSVVKDTVVLIHGHAGDDRGLKTLIYGLVGTDPAGGTPIPFTDARSVDFTIRYRWGDSPLRMVVWAWDSAGNGASDTVDVWYDDQPPWVKVVAPAVAGSATQRVLVEAIDMMSGNYAGDVARIAWQVGSESAHLIAQPNVLALDTTGIVPFTADSTTLNILVDDWGRNRSSATASVRRVNDVVSFSTGPMSTCAVDGDGAAWCWGSNDVGQLGDGTTQERYTPVRVAGLPALKAIALGLGITCALTTSGDAYCWGAWAQKPTLIPGGHTFTSITAGGSACGLDAAGAAWCWGDVVTTPRAVAFDQPLTAISAGWDHVCGLTAAGAAYCWGRNNIGQLGIGRYSDSAETTPVAVVGGLAFTSISGGDWYTCALTAAGKAYCWGFADAGKLGNGSGAGGYNTPQTVVDDHTFTAIAAGNERTCALDAAGRTWCWGIVRDNGIGSYTFLTVGAAYVSWPIRAVPGLTFTKLSAGGATCGLSTDHGVYCWGTFDRGPLGNGP